MAYGDTLESLLETYSLEQLRGQLEIYSERIAEDKQYLGKPIPEDWIGDSDYAQTEEDLQREIQEQEAHLELVKETIAIKENQVTSE